MLFGSPSLLPWDGSMFSLSGSLNLTAFLVVFAAADAVVLVAVLDRVRVVLLVTASDAAAVEFPCVRVLLRALARAARELVEFTVDSVAGFLVTLALDARDAAKDGASLSVKVPVLVRPRGFLASSARSSSSPSVSSARVLRFAAVLLVPDVAEEDDPAALALAAAVRILVVLTPDSFAFAAARARVIRFGGESMVGIACLFV